MTLKVATLLCVYGGDSPELFGAALRSVLSQRLDSAVESRVYLGVDGPLTASLERVISHFEHCLFVVKRGERNLGLARTLNALIERLEDEEFVFRMDADDESSPERYQAQLDYLRSHPDIDILGTAITEYDSASGSTRIVKFARDPDDAMANLHRRVPVAHPTVCFRRRVLDAVKGYPERGTNEDVALWFACARAGFRFDNLPDSYLRFRISPAFWKRRGVRKAFSELQCYVRGIHDVHGPFSLRYLFPVARFVLRLSPVFISRWLYGSRFRSRD